MGNTEGICCPYCGEAIEIVLDPSVGSQEYVEDCYVCCRPIVFTVKKDRFGEFTVTVRKEND